MMANMNRITLVGTVQGGMTMTATSKGELKARIRVSTVHRWKNADEDILHTETDLHTVIGIGNMAKRIRDFSFDGHLVLIEGRLRMRKWATYEDTGAGERPEIVVSTFQDLGVGPSECSPQDNEVDHEINSDTLDRAR